MGGGQAPSHEIRNIDPSSLAYPITDAVFSFLSLLRFRSVYMRPLTASQAVLLYRDISSAHAICFSGTIFTVPARPSRLRPLLPQRRCVIDLASAIAPPQRCEFHKCGNLVAWRAEKAIITVMYSGEFLHDSPASIRTKRSTTALSPLGLLVLTGDGLRRKSGTPFPSFVSKIEITCWQIHACTGRSDHRRRTS